MTDIHISQLFPEIPKAELRPKIRSNRAYVISLFVEKLQPMSGSSFKPIKPAFVAFKMSHMSVNELYEFYDACEKASCGFNKYWWWSLNPKKHKTGDNFLYTNKPFKKYN